MRAWACVCAVRGGGLDGAKRTAAHRDGALGVSQAEADLGVGEQGVPLPVALVVDLSHGLRNQKCHHCDSCGQCGWRHHLFDIARRALRPSWFLCLLAPTLHRVVSPWHPCSLTVDPLPRGRRIFRSPLSRPLPRLPPLISPKPPPDDEPFRRRKGSACPPRPCRWARCWSASPVGRCGRWVTRRRGHAGRGGGGGGVKWVGDETPRPEPSQRPVHSDAPAPPTDRVNELGEECSQPEHRGRRGGSREAAH